MCGVFGWYLHRGELSQKQVDAARAATTSMAHRGPDNQGEWTGRNVYLGHRRLGIIDLSAAANQPFVDDQGGVLIFNGEIYNYIELRAELEKLGHAFRTKSDTEVVVAAIRQWDLSAFNRFDGMFAGSWHDPKTNRHVLFRDPLGQKPLYWHSTGAEILYASELGALLALPDRQWRLDRAAFQRFVANSYYGWSETPIKDIRKVLPGCLVIAEHGQVTVRRYWTSTPASEPQRSISDEDALNSLEELLSISCRRSMRSDVPYGVFLSGGIDSSLILDFCREANPDVHTFSVAMEERSFDESSKADYVSKKLGIRNHMAFTMGRLEIADCFQEVIDRSDEPHADPGLVHTYFLAKSVRPHVTVGIAGDGGDELFGGYAAFAALKPARLVARLSPSILNLLKASARSLPSTDKYMGLRFKALAFMQGFPAEDELRLPHWLASLPPELLASLFLDPLSEGSTPKGGRSLFSIYEEPIAPARAGTDIQKSLQFYQQVFLPEFVCMHTDRGAMLNSLEVRSPFLSPDIIEFANGLPDHFKVRGNTLKWILRKLASRRGYSRQITKQAKQGFTFPVARWIKGPLRSTIERLLFDESWRDDRLIDTSELKRIWEQHLSGSANNYRIIYNLAVFRAWRNRYKGLGT